MMMLKLVPTNNYGLFITSKNPNSNYLIETNPEFSRDVTTARAEAGSNFANHSQANYLFNSGVKYIDSKGSYEDGGYMKTQDMFTATQAQLNNPSHTPDTSMGLEDNSFVLVPMTKVATTTAQGVTTVTKITASKVDDVVLSTGIKVDNTIQNTVVPNVKDGYYRTANKFLEDPSKYTQGGLDAIESYLPGVPSASKVGYGVAIGYEVYNELAKEDK